MITAIEHYRKLETEKEKILYFDTCVNLMCDGLREELHGTIDNAEEFLEAYCKFHLIKFDEEFVVN